MRPTQMADQLVATTGLDHQVCVVAAYRRQGLVVAAGVDVILMQRVVAGAR